MSPQVSDAIKTVNGFLKSQNGGVVPPAPTGVPGIGSVPGNTIGDVNSSSLDNTLFSPNGTLSNSTLTNTSLTNGNQNKKANSSAGVSSVASFVVLAAIGAVFIQ